MIKVWPVKCAQWDLSWDKGGEMQAWGICFDGRIIILASQF